MRRIGGTDPVLLLLQEQIARLAKDRAKAGRTSAIAGASVKQPLTRLRALAKRDGLSDDDLNHALVRSVLIERLGEALGNDPRFEALAGDVVRIIAASADGAALLGDAFQRLGKR